MSDQNVEKNPPKDHAESVEEDYGLKKLTVYTLSISITCLLIVGVWYKKDEIPFSVMYDSTAEFYNKSTDTLSNSYNSIIDHLSEDKPVIQETARTPESKPASSNEATFLTADKITEDVIVMANEDSNTTSIEEEKELEVVNFETEKAPAIATIEKSTENVTPIIKIDDDIAESVAVIESAESIELVVKEADIPASELPIIENMEVTENVLIKVITETPLVTSMTEKSVTPDITEAEAVAVTSVISQTSPVKHQTPVVPGRVAPARIINGPREYVYSPYPYNAANSRMMFNNLQRNNIQPSNRGYMNQVNIIEQQRRSFEQNMQLQQQMMQQAFRMQSAIFKDADRRHQEMLKRVANWKAESQKRREFYKSAPFDKGYHY